MPGWFLAFMKYSPKNNNNGNLQHSPMMLWALGPFQQERELLTFVLPLICWVFAHNTKEFNTQMYTRTQTWQMALDIVLSFTGTCKVICLSKGQSSPYDQLSRILPLLGEKRATPTTASPPVGELGLIYSNILVLGRERKITKTRCANACTHISFWV